MNSKIFRQYDSRWGSKPYPTAKSSFAGNGCGACSITHCAIELDAYKSITPETVRKWMVAKNYAVSGWGTKWAGIPEGLKHFGFSKVIHIGIDDPMTKAWTELNKKNRIGIILFSSGYGGSTKKVYWTSSGHYVAFTDYKYKNNKHYFYMKDSGPRKNDGWFTYEDSMKGVVSQLWIVQKPVPKATVSSTRSKYLSGLEMYGKIVEKEFTYLNSGSSPLWTTANKKKTTNCAKFIGFSLQYSGVLPKGYYIYWKDNQIRGNGASLLKKSPKVDIIKVGNKTLKQLIKENKLKPGDIVLSKGCTHTQAIRCVKDGVPRWYSAGPGNIKRKNVRNARQAGYDTKIVMKIIRVK